ncbi:hypothetical protein [Micromonospora sp. NPDC048063]|uniref:hypothetical protein n=1 Tax=Micromonospora sp. NPDC048063 TaxID=3364256 RepID=UPI003715D645
MAEATAEEPAYAAGPPRLCALGDLLDSAGAIADGSLSCTASSAADRGSPAIVAVGVGPAARGKAPVGAIPSDGVDSVTEVAEPVTRRVVGDAPPAVREAAGAGPLEPVGAVVRPVVEPVGAVVRPVVEPVVEALAPALAPVLELTQPIVGPPVAPRPPAGDPADVVPAPAEDVPAVTAPATDEGPMPVRPMIPGVMPHIPSSAATTSPATGESTPAGAPGVGATEASHPIRQSSPAHVPGVTPAASGSSAGNSSAGGWTGTAVGTALGSWAPEPESQGWCASRGEELADRPRQPDTRPA